MELIQFHLLGHAQVKLQLFMIWQLLLWQWAKFKLLKREGHKVPLGTGLNKAGKETTDPGEIADGGVLLPFGGYKGSSIAMMVELLAGALIGESFSYETAANDNNDGGPPKGGEFILAISPEKIAGPGWNKHADEFFNKMSSMEGVQTYQAKDVIKID